MTADLRAHLKEARVIAGLVVIPLVNWMKIAEALAEQAEPERRCGIHDVAEFYRDEPAQPQQEPVAFWMIERLHSVEHEYGWWFRGSADPTNKDNWTTNAAKAARFPSGESAACALSALKPPYIRGAAKDEAFYKLVKPTEHMWFVSPPAQAVPEGWPELKQVEWADYDQGYNDGIRACEDALAAAPKPEEKP